jgi:hypothetical protein
VGHPLWREGGSEVYSCCWTSPAQSFSGPSPAGLMTMLPSQILDSPILEGQVPVFISLKNGVVRLYSQALRFRNQTLKATRILRQTVTRPVNHWGAMTKFLLRPESYGLLTWGTFSDTRTGLKFTAAAGPSQQESQDRILLSQTWGSCSSPKPNTELPVLVT